MHLQFPLLSLLRCCSWDVLDGDSINVDPPTFHTDGSTFTALCVYVFVHIPIYTLEKEMATQYSCLENSMGRGYWWATVHGLTQLDMTEELSTHAFIFTTVFYACVYVNEGFLDGSVVKNLPAKQEMRVWFLGQEDSLEEKMATHSSILAWKIAWTEEPGRLQSMGCHMSQTQLSEQAHICEWIYQSSMCVHGQIFLLFLNRATEDTNQLAHGYLTSLPFIDRQSIFSCLLQQ